MKKQAVIKFLRLNVLTIATMVGVLLGIAISGGIRSSLSENLSARSIMYIAFPGELFLRMLRSVIIPLVIPSLIVSIGSLDLKSSSKIGGLAVLYYGTTTVISVILGIILVVSIRPGESTSATPLASNLPKQNVTTPDTLMDLLRNCFPPNIIQATMQQHRMAIKYPGTDGIIDNNYTVINGSDKHTWDFEIETRSNSNILGLIVFSVVVGIAIAACGEDGRPLLRFFQSLSTVMMKITVWIVHLAPIGVCFLIIGKVLAMKSFSDTFNKLGKYFGTVLLGLGLHGLIILPLIYVLITRKSPVRFILNMGNALMTAFGTSSSSATLPLTINNLEEKNNVDPSISRFVLPIGATINMDGTALYEAVAAIFIAQYRGISLSFSNLVSISITATGASIGAAGIPQAGIVTMVMVLDTVGLPSEDVGLIYAVDWLLDRFRTTINVLGDSIGAGIINHIRFKDHKPVNKDIIEKNHKGNESDLNYESTEM